MTRFSKLVAVEWNEGEPDSEGTHRSSGVRSTCFRQKVDPTDRMPDCNGTSRQRGQPATARRTAISSDCCWRQWSFWRDNMRARWLKVALPQEASALEDAEIEFVGGKFVISN